MIGVGVGMGATAALSKGVGVPFGVYNYAPSYLTRWRARRNAVRSGASSDIILCMGDSTTAGLDSQGTVSALHPVGMKVAAYAAQLASRISSAGIPSQAQNSFGDFGYGANDVVYDSRLSRGSWVLNGGVRHFAGQAYGATGAGNGTLSFTPTAQTDTVQIFYVTNGSTGAFNANINGGSDTLCSTTAAAGYGVLTLSGALGSNTYNVTWASGGSVFVLGFNAFNSASKNLSIINMGKGGAHLSEMFSVWATPAALLATISPALTFIQFGINDAHSGDSITTFAANLAALVDAAQVQSDVVLISPIQSKAAFTSYAVQQPYLDAYKTVAVSKGCVLLDQNARNGGFDGANAKGLMASDGIHGLSAYYADEAAALAQLLAL